MIHRIKMFQSYWHLRNFRSHNDLDLGYTCLGLKSALLPSLWGTRIQRHTQVTNEVFDQPYTIKH